jgi:hypothetical protein
VSNLGFIPDLNPAAAKLQAGATSAKTAAAKAQILADTYKVEKKHWDKLSRAEQKFQKAMNTLDMIYPEHKRGLADKLSKQVGIIALFAALALIGSTALLHIWVNR